MNRKDLIEHTTTPRFIILSALVTALFVILFPVVYDPVFGFDDLTLWKAHSAFCIPILASITLVVLLLSRFGCRLFLRRYPLTTVQYLLWQLVEFVVVCLFADLFLSLFFHQGYFDLLPRIILVGMLVLIFPYVVMGLVARCECQSALLEQLQSESQSSSDGEDDQTVIRFVDERKQTRLAVQAEHIIYLESAGNYVNIIYDDDGRVRRYSLRNTLKAIEETCSTHKLVRCHRSYFINIHHVKVLRRDHDQLFAKMDLEGIDDIPVSKSYASEVIALLS